MDGRSENPTLGVRRQDGNFLHHWDQSLLGEIEHVDFDSDQCLFPRHIESNSANALRGCEGLEEVHPFSNIEQKDVH